MTPGLRTFMTIVRSEPVCDFCAATPVRWRYRAETFNVTHYVPAALAAAIKHDQIHNTSEEDWAACDDCHTIIEAGDRVTLLNRALRANHDASIPGVDVPHDMLAAMIKTMHDGFFNHRRGEAEPHSPRESA